LGVTTSYATMLQEGNLTFPIYDVSRMHVNGKMIIFASLELPTNTSLVNQVWQEGLVSDDGRLEAHAMTGPNIQSFGTLDFKSGIVSENIGGGKVKSKTMLRNVSYHMLIYFIFLFNLGDHLLLFYR
jgi:hypothetical protein